MRGSHILGGMVIILLSSCSFIFTTFAAGDIPRDGLRLELLLATGAQDTSGNNRAVTSTGVAPTFQTDSTYGVQYAQFSGSGGLKVNTSWSATTTDDFTLSMWIKADQSIFSSIYAGGFTNNVYIYFPEIASTGYPTRSYTPIRYPTTILSAKNGEIEDSGFHLTLNNNGKCGLRSSKERITSMFSSTMGVYSDLPYDYNILNSVYAAGVRSGMFTAMQDMLDCSVLKDSKWHNLIVRKQAGKIELLIDEVSLGKLNSTISFFRNLSIGNIASFAMDQSIYGHFDQNTQNKIYSNHYFRGGVMGIRVYSRAITDNDINALNEELRYAQGDITGASNVQVTMDRYTKPTLSFYLKNIPLNLAKENVVYQYSTSTGNFVNISSESLQNISASTGSIDYRASLDLSAVPDGRVNITLRVRSGETYYNIGTVGFIKNDTNYVISINQPDTLNALSKTISATSNIGGSLSLFLTRGSVCDGTITTWDEYSDLTFTSNSDNFMRVCYKAFFPQANKTVYKISQPIEGISQSNQYTPISNFFGNYNLWVKSSYAKPNDSTSLVLDLLGVSATQSQGTINGVTMTDINGDGLVDFLYSRNDPIRRAIVVNKGDYTFKTAYKCAIDTANNVSTYYGDCADTTR